MNIVHSLFGQKETVSLKDLVANGAMIIDVRSKEEYAVGHVEGSKNIPLDTLQSSCAVLGAKDQLIITCCQSGGRSTVAKNLLENEGFTRVYNGGGWKTLQAEL